VSHVIFMYCQPGSGVGVGAGAAHLEHGKGMAIHSTLTVDDIPLPKSDDYSCLLLSFSPDGTS
jgi:hypothetical protein